MGVFRAMGRIFETRKATMFKRWDRMSKAFARCGREITMAVRQGGEDPGGNPALRRAIQNARDVNMPKDKIAYAIKRANNKDTADYKEVIYEGYAAHGVAILAVSSTDNPTRTIANVRVCFNKGGGTIGTSGSVSFGFDRLGVFRIDPDQLKDHDLEELELDLIDFGLEEMGQGTNEKGKPRTILHCAMQDFGKLQAALEDRDIQVASTTSEFIAQNMVELDDAKAEEVMKLVDMLEQDEDVQQVFHNLT